jgi:hypothetical protein
MWMKVNDLPDSSVVGGANSFRMTDSKLRFEFGECAKIVSAKLCFVGIRHAPDEKHLKVKGYCT